VVAVVPALCGIVASERAQHPAAPETEFDRGVVDERVPGREETRNQPGVIRQRGQQIAKQRAFLAAADHHRYAGHRHPAGNQRHSARPFAKQQETKAGC
jgi:hypothetical protein